MSRGKLAVAGRGSQPTGALQATSPWVAAALAGEHDQLAAALHAARAARDAGQCGEALAGLDRFRCRLLQHLLIEEELVFPTFEIRAGLPRTGPTGTMSAEHDQLRECLDELVRALQQGHEAAERERALERLLLEHRRKEESLLYPALDRLLSPRKARHSRPACGRCCAEDGAVVPEGQTCVLPAAEFDRLIDALRS